MGNRYSHLIIGRIAIIFPESSLVHIYQNGINVAILLLGTYPREIICQVCKTECSRMFTAMVFDEQKPLETT